MDTVNTEHQCCVDHSSVFLNSHLMQKGKYSRAGVVDPECPQCDPQSASWSKMPNLLISDRFQNKRELYMSSLRGLDEIDYKSQNVLTAINESFLHLVLIKVCAKS